jgi:glycosyltransferase involved in cell wall biosynthesis
MASGVAEECILAAAKGSIVPGRAARGRGRDDALDESSAPASVTMPNRTLLIITQVYVPDPAAVGQHIADAAEEMASRGHDVLVYTSARGYDDPSIRYPSREVRGGVHIRRLPLSSFGKRSIAVRLLAQAIFLAQATALALFRPGLAAVVVSTSPPFAGLAGVLISRLRRIPLTWWVMDLNPDQMIAAGRIDAGSLPARVFDWINRATLRRATHVVALDRFMKDRLARKLPVPEKIEIIPPWPLADQPRPAPREPNAFRTAHGLDGAFVVMYSGNHAAQNPLTTLLEAAKQLVAEPRLRFVFVGGGVGKAAVNEAVVAGATNVLSLPYQPKETLGTSLAAADLHVVSVGDETVGIVHPCKTYGAMAIGRPILLLGPAACPAGEILAGGGCGWRVAHGDVAATMAALREAASLPAAELEAMGARAAAVVAGRFSRAALRAALCDLLAPGLRSGADAE